MIAYLISSAAGGIVSTPRGGVEIYQILGGVPMS